jgi:hypothetical protein
MLTLLSLIPVSSANCETIDGEAEPESEPFANIFGELSLIVYTAEE